MISGALHVEEDLISMPLGKLMKPETRSTLGEGRALNPARLHLWRWQADRSNPARIRLAFSLTPGSSCSSILERCLDFSRSSASACCKVPASQESDCEWVPLPGLVCDSADHSETSWCQRRGDKIRCCPCGQEHTVLRGGVESLRGFGAGAGAHGHKSALQLYFLAVERMGPIQTLRPKP